MALSIIIRTLNEARWLGDLLAGIAAQEGAGPVEVIVVDSGSTDGTREIAEAGGARIVRIDRSEFTFGRSLNRGCEAATGEVLVFVSGHCIPAGPGWLAALAAAFDDPGVAYAYGRQVGGAGTRFSEERLFEKYFPADPARAQGGFFCNNANAALRRADWAAHRFDEALTGLEDMELAKRLLAAGRGIAYVPEAVVHHLHDETWAQVRRRYEREAIALREITPEMHFRIRDLVRYTASAIWLDARAALGAGRFPGALPEIAMFRAMQYYGAFRGNLQHRELSQEAKERYFYPGG